MATSLTSYYGLIRVREMSPDAKDWAATDGNPEAISKILKFLEQHHHNAGTPFHYPGYNSGDPTSPTFSSLSEITSGGILTPGTSIGVRLAYQNSLGLETDAAPEASISLASAVGRPDPPTLSSTASNASGLSGGTYVYALTKKKGTGETLPSDILPVTIAYDQTYRPTIAFDAINSYSDGTTAICLYRANGLNAAFQLVTTITSTSQVTYVDTGAIADAGAQPPSSATFDASRKVRIDWTTAVGTPPTGAVKLIVYVTQQTGIWGNNCVLATYDIPGQPTFVDYLGSEALASGSPLQASQIPSNPPKIDLSTEATGAPTLTANMNFAGFQAQNVVMHSTTSPTTTNGAIYYDTSLNQMRARINGAWVNWGTSTSSAYTHPALESGGHDAANIKYRSTGANVTVTSILDRITNSSTGAAVLVQLSGFGTPTTSNPTVSATSSSTSIFIPECSITIPTQTFTGQAIEAVFNGQFKITLANQILNIGFEVNGSLDSSSIRSMMAPVNNYTFPMTLNALYTTGNVVLKVLWWVTTSGSSATAVGTQRYLRARLVF